LIPHTRARARTLQAEHFAVADYYHNALVARMQNPDAAWANGWPTLAREELETAHAAQRPLDIRVLGLVTIAPDVTPDLARAAIASISVLGTLQASPAVKAALADRVR
jgi:Ribbon-Helix-Helix transcriptional regulator family